MLLQLGSERTKNVRSEPSFVRQNQALYVQNQAFVHFDSRDI